MARAVGANAGPDLDAYRAKPGVKRVEQLPEAAAQIAQLLRATPAGPTALLEAAPHPRGGYIGRSGTELRPQQGPPDSLQGPVTRGLSEPIDCRYSVERLPIRDTLEP